jgi:hypothetical protein
MQKYLYLAALVGLVSCTNNTATTEKKEMTKDAAPAPVATPSAGEGLTAGVYHAYQLSGSGFGYQYKFELTDNGQYKMFDKTGSYVFDAPTKVIRFTSGALKDYVGIFTRNAYLNENRKLMIVIDFHGDGAVPDTTALGKKPGGYYQYAYLQDKK